MNAADGSQLPTEYFPTLSALRLVTVEIIDSFWRLPGA